MVEANYVKDESANLFCNIPEEGEGIGRDKIVCKHYRGLAYWILKEWDLELPRFVGEIESALMIDENGVCKCQRCHKVFSVEEQQRMEKLIAYLNTPHYCTKEDFAYHKEWDKILEYYDEGYLEENEPFKLFNLEKALELSEGIEPVVFRYKNSLKQDIKTKIISSMKWEDGSWKIKKGFFHKMKMKGKM